MANICIEHLMHRNRSLKKYEQYTKQVANIILYELYLFHFNLRNDKSILEQTVIQIRFLSIRHINQDQMFKLQHSMNMQVDDLII